MEIFDKLFGKREREKADIQKTKRHISQFADKLLCQYCSKAHGTKEWPVNGDKIPFYFQEEPGNYTLKVICPHCGKEWYVVWDDDPGPIKPLLI